MVEFELAEIEIILEPGKNAGEIIEEVLNEIKTNGFENTAINFSKSTTQKRKDIWVGLMKKLLMTKFIRLYQS